MLIALWQGSTHPHGAEHVSPPSKVKVNIIAVSHFFMLQLLSQLLLIDLFCQGCSSGKPHAASTVQGDRGRSQSMPREVNVKYSK